MSESPVTTLIDCPMCAAKFEKPGELIAHLNTVHPKKPDIEDPEQEFEMHLMISVRGFGKRKDRLALASVIKDELTVYLHQPIKVDILSVQSQGEIRVEEEVPRRRWRKMD